MFSQALKKRLGHSQIGLLFRGCSVISLSWPQDPTQINSSYLVSSVQMEGGEGLELANLHLFVELDLSYVCSNMFFLLGPFLFVVKKAIKNSEPRYQLKKNSRIFLFFFYQQIKVFILDFVVYFRFFFKIFFLVVGVFVLLFFSHTGVVNGYSSSYKAINSAIAKTSNLRNVTIVVRRFTISKDTNLVDQGNVRNKLYA